MARDRQAVIEVFPLGAVGDVVDHSSACDDQQERDDRRHEGSELDTGTHLFESDALSERAELLEDEQQGLLTE